MSSIGSFFESRKRTVPRPCFFLTFSPPPPSPPNTHTTPRRLTAGRRAGRSVSKKRKGPTPSPSPALALKGTVAYTCSSLSQSLLRVEGLGPRVVSMESSTTRIWPRPSRNSCASTFRIRRVISRATFSATTAVADHSTAPTTARPGTLARGRAALTEATFPT